MCPSQRGNSAKLLRETNFSIHFQRKWKTKVHDEFFCFHFQRKRKTKVKDATANVTSKREESRKKSITCN